MTFSNSEPLPTWTYRVKQGGLMRCCLLSLEEAMAERVENHLGPPQEGDTLACRYESTTAEKMVYHDDCWEWVG